MTSSSSSKVRPPRHKLYDMPVSNNGARCRIVLRKMRIAEGAVSIVSPAEIGGLKSAEFLALNPQGKMPLLIRCDGGTGDDECDDGGGPPPLPHPLPESDTICRYLLSAYGNVGAGEGREAVTPSFLPDDPTSNLIVRLHDTYIGPIQGCLYKSSPPFGIYRTRSEALVELRRQLCVVNDLIPEYGDGDGDGGGRGGPYLLGSEVSLADATLFPTAAFVRYMLPKFEDGDGNGADNALPAEMGRWYDEVRERDDDFARVHDEVSF